jgi:hypothetical protein
MDKLRNPFSPGAGTPPPELAGRSDILDQALMALARIKSGRSEKSVLMVGLRGVGKTVLLNKIELLARDAWFGYWANGQYQGQARLCCASELCERP